MTLVKGVKGLPARVEAVYLLSPSKGLTYEQAATSYYRRFT